MDFGKNLYRNLVGVRIFVDNPGRVRIRSDNNPREAMDPGTLGSEKLRNVPGWSNGIGNIGGGGIRTISRDFDELIRNANPGNPEIGDHSPVLVVKVFDKEQLLQVQLARGLGPSLDSVRGQVAALHAPGDAPIGGNVVP